MKDRIDRIGEEKTNTFGSLMRIINYRKYNDIDVYFEEYDYTKTNVNYNNFQKGTISCPYEPRVYKVGYIGIGKYKVSENRKRTKCYSVWSHMLERCYDSKCIAKRPTYKECDVCSEWYNFQNFAGWFEKNFYQIEGERIELDKDILIKGNKIYSPNTCVFVPQPINTLFTKRDNCRGGLPIGVVYKNKKYVAQCNINGKMKTLGYYDTPEKAFQVYKNHKENYIKKVADQYKDKIPQKLYDGLISYKIEIND